MCLYTNTKKRLDVSLLFFIEVDDVHETMVNDVIAL